MTSDHFRMWLEAYFANIDPNSVLFIDSWTGHCPNTISDLTPPGTHITTDNIERNYRENTTITCL